MGEKKVNDKKLVITPKDALVFYRIQIQHMAKGKGAHAGVAKAFYIGLST